MDKYGIPIYKEQDFYAIHKITREDFLDKIESLSESQREKEITKLFENESITGRNTRLTEYSQRKKLFLERKNMHPRMTSGLRGI